MNDKYTKGLVALHNLGVALDEVRDMPRGTAGFPVTEDPLDFVVEELTMLMSSVCGDVAIAKKEKPWAKTTKLK